MLDIHTHFFKEKAAAMIIRKLSAASGFVPCCNGTLEGTVEQLDLAGIQHCAYLPIAVTPAQQRLVNDFAAEINGSHQGRVIAFGSLHPAAEDLEEEMKRIKDLGLAGIKFHPQYQQVYIDDPKTEHMIRLAGEMGLPLLFHAGVDPGLPGPLYAPVEKIARLIDNLGDMQNITLIGAHLGGLLEWDAVEKLLVGSPMYLDTAIIGGRCPAEQYRRVIRQHGAEKIFFGSDCPWQSPAEALSYLRSLDLTEEEFSLITTKNAEKLFDLAGKNTQK